MEYFLQQSRPFADATLLLFSNERFISNENHSTLSAGRICGAMTLSTMVFGQQQRASGCHPTASTAGRFAANSRRIVADMASRVFRSRGAGKLNNALLSPLRT